MKTKTFLSAAWFIAGLVMAGCAVKHDTMHDAADASDVEWAEMDSFHTVMAETFHPYKDSANLEPVKLRAREMMEAASRWNAAPLPEKVDTEQVRSMLKKLEAEAIALAGIVESADDNLIGDKLTALHDTFHDLQEAWYGGHEDVE